MMRNRTPIRVGVVGTGVMGGHHARVAATLVGCQLTGVYDVNFARAEEVAAQYGAQAFRELPALCDQAEAIIVASPTVTHAEVATVCLQHGCHVLLEKPIAATVAEAEALIPVAQQCERTLMIGHIERYNPAFVTLKSLVDPAEVFDCELQRLSPVPGRDRTADIICDLMIHDLDLALALTQSTPHTLSATGHRVRCEFIDHVSAMISFANGATVRLTASAVSQERVRRGRLFTPQAQYTVDFARREVWIHRQGQSSLTRSDGQYQIMQQVEQILVPNKEPLAAEQEHFLHAIATQTCPDTAAEAGLAALRLAVAIQLAVQEQLHELIADFGLQLA